MTSLDLASKLKKILDEKRIDNNAAVGAVFYIDGKLSAAFSCGTVDGEETSPVVTDESLFNIGSISKVYCAMAVMKLVELGLCSLDTPICEYLPRFKMWDERYKKITLRMCLRHSSGLPGTFMNGLFGSLWIGNDFYEKFYGYLEKSVLKSTPDSYSVYCNDGFTLAEMVIVELSGMEYTDFLKKYITEPAGANSAGTGASTLDAEKRVREKGTPQETLSALGSGGVVSTVADCALVGNLFIDGRQVLSEQSLSEIASPQGVSFLQGEVASDFGYGWDSVNFKHSDYDFGDGVLMKSGGTLQFSTYLLVCPKLKLSAVMSATMSNGIDVLDELCRLCSVLMNEMGIELETPQTSAPQEMPLPTGFAEQHEGVYHNFMGAYQVDFPEGKLRLRSYADGTFQDMIPDAVFDGEWFNFGPLSFSFQHNEDRNYLMQKGVIGVTAFAETVPWEQEIAPEWEARAGRKYITCDFDPHDIGIGNMYCGLRIDKLKNSNLLLFCTKTTFLPFGATPVAFSGDESRMPLTAPGGAGSRDQFAPLVYLENGIEYIYDRGYLYRDTESLPVLPKGHVALTAGVSLYAVPKECRIRFANGVKTRIILLSEDLSIICDEWTSDALLNVEGGYVAIASNEDAVLYAD